MRQPERLKELRDMLLEVQADIDEADRQLRDAVEVGERGAAHHQKGVGISMSALENLKRMNAVCSEPSSAKLSGNVVVQVDKALNLLAGA